MMKKLGEVLKEFGIASAVMSATGLLALACRTVGAMDEAGVDGDESE